MDPYVLAYWTKVCLAQRHTHDQEDGLTYCMMQMIIAARQIS